MDAKKFLTKKSRDVRERRVFNFIRKFQIFLPPSFVIYSSFGKKFLAFILAKNVSNKMGQILSKILCRTTTEK